MRNKFLCGLLLVSLATFCQAAKVNEEAPAFQLKDLNGHDVSLSDFKGKSVVLVNFWATWCPPCNQEFPKLSELAEAYKDKGLQVLAISIDTSRPLVDKFLKKLKTKPAALTVLLDPQSKVVAQYDAQAMPTSFIVDRGGKVRFIHLGYSVSKDPPAWRHEIDGLLAEKK